MDNRPQPQRFRLRFRTERFSSVSRAAVRFGLILYVLVTILLTLQIFGLFSLNIPGHVISEKILGNGDQPEIVRAGRPDETP